jgi:paraquat-inducible protein B
MTEVKRTQAGTRMTRWPGWIWSVPIAAVALVSWLLVRAISGHGVRVTVVFDDATGVTANGTDVTYRGIKIGQVTGAALSPDRRHVNVTLSIDGDMKAALNTGSSFYLEGAHPSLSDLSSLKSILSGPTIVIVPGRGSATRHFVASPGPPPDSVGTAAHYLVRLDGPVGDIEIGAPVTLRGFIVGHVLDARLVYDPRTGKLGTPVEIGLDPTRLGANVSTLVQEGMRARLTRSPPFIGSPHVELAIVPGAPPRAAGAEIPVAPSTGVEPLIARLDELPVAAIGANVRAITAHVRSLVSRPELPAAIDHLDSALATLDSTMRQVGPALPPMIQQLGQTANQLDAMVVSLRRVTGESPAAPEGNLRDALRELTGAARAMRTLADFLDQHPEALVSGRER